MSDGSGRVLFKKTRNDRSGIGIIDKICIFLLAICPILQNYIGIINAGVTAFAVVFPYAVVKLLKKRYIPVRCFRIILPLTLFLIYKVIDHGTSMTEVGHVVFYFVYSLAFCAGVFDSNEFINAATAVACAASVCIVIQYICYYVLGFHLQLVPTSLLVSGSSQWIRLAETGRISITGRRIAFYRPSAFFLEPSHMFVYLCAPLVYKLLAAAKTDNKDRKTAILLSVGMILSTSGMGIIVTVALWLLYLAKRGGKDRRLSVAKLLQPKNILLLVSITTVLLILYFRVDFFHRSVARIFSSGTDYRNAVSSRVDAGGAFIGQMRGKQLLIGISDHYSDVDFHMTGFNATMYKFGIIGTLLSYLFYIRCLRELKDAYFWLALILIGVSFFTPHTHGTFYMLFFIIFLLSGFNKKTEAALTAEQENTANQTMTV